MEYKSDMMMALEALEGEIKGVEEYKEMHGYAEDVGLKKIFADALNSERQHAGILLNWINSKAQGILK